MSHVVERSVMVNETIGQLSNLFANGNIVRSVGQR